MTPRQSRELRTFLREKRHIELRDREVSSLAKALGRLEVAIRVLIWIGVVGELAAAVDVSS